LCRQFYGGGGGADRAGIISVSAILRSLVQYLGGRERGGLYNYCSSILNHFCVGAIILEGKTIYWLPTHPYLIKYFLLN
jgi:hypothetical protein